MVIWLDLLRIRTHVPAPRTETAKRRTLIRKALGNDEIVTQQPLVVLRIRDSGIQNLLDDRAGRGGVFFSTATASSTFLPRIRSITILLSRRKSARIRFGHRLLSLSSCLF
jgi:hypothetical protein